MRGRELLLIIRAQDNASRILRRMAGDMRALGRVQDLQLARQRLALQQARTASQRMRAERQLQQALTGTRALGMERARLNNLIQQASLEHRLAQATKARRSAQARLAGATSALNKATDKQVRAERLLARNRLAEIYRDRSFRVNDLTSRMKSNAKQASVLNAREAELARSAHLARRRISELAQQQAIQTRMMRDLNTEIRQARWERFGTYSRLMGHFGRSLQMVGLVGGAAIGFAANAAAKFETQIRLVATQTGKAGSGIGVLMKNAKELEPIILGVMRESTASTQDLTQAAYDLFSSVDTQGKTFLTLRDGSKLLKLANRAAIAGQTDLQTATMGIIRVMNTFGVTAEQMPRRLDRAFAAVRFGEMTFEQYNEALKTTAPAARQFSQSHDQMSGAIAFLSRRLGVQRAAIGYARALEILGDQKFGEEMLAQGVRVRDAQNQMLPLPELLDNILTKFPKLKSGQRDLEEFFKTFAGRRGFIQARRALVFMFQQFPELAEMIQRVTEDNVEFNRSFDAMSQTAGVRWAKFLNQMRALFLELGAAAIPTLLEIFKPIQRLIKWFSNLDKETKRNIGRMIVLASAVALIGGTFLAVAGGVLAFVAAMGRAGMIFKGFTVIALAAVAAMKVFTGEWSDLKSSLSGIGDIFFKSWQGFVAGTILAVAAIGKVRRALIGLRLAVALGAGGTAAAAAGGGGLLPMLFGSGRDFQRKMSALNRLKSIRIAGGMSKFGASMRMAGMAALMLPGPLKIAAAAMAAMGIGALIWSRRSQDGAEAIAEAAREAELLRQQIERPLRAAQEVGDFGGGFRDWRRARLDYLDAKDAVKELRQELQGLQGAERRQVSRALERAVLDRADAYDVLTTAHARMMQGSNAVQRFFRLQAENLDAIGSRTSIIGRLQGFIREAERLAQFGPGFVRGVPAMLEQFNLEGMGIKIADPIKSAMSLMQRLRGEIDQTKEASAQAALVFDRKLGKSVRMLMTAQVLPQAGKGVVQNIADFAKEIGRMPTLKEMKAIIRVGVEPDLSDLKQLPGKVKAFFLKQKAEKVELKVEAAINRIRVSRGEAGLIPKAAKNLKATMNVQANTKAALLRAEEARSKIDSKKADIKVNADTSDALRKLRELQGVLNSLQDKTINVSVNKRETTTNVTNTITNTVRTATREATAVMTEEVARGLAATEEVMATTMERATQTSLAKVSSTVKKNRQKMRKTVRYLFADSIKEAVEESMSVINALFSDVDEKLDKLREKNKNAQLTAKMLTASMRAQLTQTIRFVNGLDKLAKRGAPQTLLEQLAQLGAEGAKYIRVLANMSGKQLRRFIRMWNQAVAAITKNANSMRTVIKSLQNDTQSGTDKLVEIFDDFREQFSNAFGQLGEGLYGGEYAFKVSSARIMKALRKQIAEFHKYRDAIRSLTSKNVPFDLIKQLMQLGPEALPYLQGLNTMTEAELAEYVKLWKEIQKELDAEAKKMMQAQIAEWKKHGKAIAAGIISGLISEREGLMKFFRNMFKQLIKEAKKELGIKSPSAVFESLGKQVMEGFQRGLTQPVLPMPVVAGSMVRGQPAGNTYYVDMDVFANSDESLQTTLERARFRLEHRVP